MNEENKGSKPLPTKLPVGKRSQVVNIRTLWQQETHFSDWLTTQDGIDLLAQDLEIEIENPRRESKGANFSCDIVANVIGDESHVVVIENQFGSDWPPLVMPLLMRQFPVVSVGCFAATQGSGGRRA